MPWKDPEQRRQHQRDRYKNDPQWAESSKTYRNTWRLADTEKRLTALSGRPRPAACEVCGRSNAGRSKIHGTVWDHNHETDLFRGWLCSQCNSILGFADDRADILLWLHDYRSIDGFGSGLSRAIDLKSKPTDVTLERMQESLERHIMGL